MTSAQSSVPASFAGPSSRAAAIALALFVVTSVVFLPACRNDFVSFDDDLYVYQNPHVLGGLTAENIAWAWTTFHASNWHPLTWWSLQLDASLFGTGPFGFHLTSVLLHAANAAVLFLALRALTGAVGPSAVVAALFAVHPLRVESVAWISERKDVLSGLCWSLALLAYAGSVRAPGIGRSFLVATALTAGLLAKPMVVTLPGVLWLLDIWPLRRATDMRALKHTTLEKWPLVAIAGVAATLTVAAQRGTAVQALSQLPLDQRVANAIVSYVTYLLQTIWPLSLAAYYPHPREQLPAAIVLIAATLLIAISAVCLWYVRRRPYLLVGWLWYLGTLVPVIGLVQVGEQAHADRYTYLPQIGLFVMAAWTLVEQNSQRLNVATQSGLAVVLLAAGVLTWQQIGVWKDNPTLWQHALVATGDSNWMAQMHLSAWNHRQKQSGPAMEHAEAAVRLVPESADARANLGVVFLSAKRYPEAERELQTALTLMPGHRRSLLYLGSVCRRTGRLDEARAPLRAVLQQNQNDAEAHHELGLVCAMSGQLDEALRHLQTAVQLDGGQWESWNNLAMAQEDAGRPRDAVASMQQALKLKPDGANLHFNLGHLFEGLHEPAAARRHYQEAVRLNPQNTSAVEALQRVP